MKANTSLYVALGITKGASKEVIKQAYYALAKKLHPDVAGAEEKESEKEAREEQFKTVTYAYDVLSDGMCSLIRLFTHNRRGKSQV
jgi:DnaJ-class molecular chaperone